MLSYSTFIGDDAMLMRECFFGGRYSDSEIDTYLKFSSVLADKLNSGVMIIFCSTR